MRLSLEYPNGRSHELDWPDEQAIEVGGEFDLYGRRWRVIGSQTRRRGRPTERVFACQPLTAGALSRGGAPDVAG